MATRGSARRLRTVLISLVLLLAMLFVSSSVVALEEEEGAGVWYVVRYGDTLSSVAIRHNTTSAAIAQANSLSNRNLIYVGQRLWIPEAGSTTPAPTETAQPGTDPAPQPGEGFWYTVRWGDTLGALARAHSVTVSAIRSANNLAGDLIRIGQRLWIPTGDTPPPNPGPTATPAPNTPEPSNPDAGEGFWYTVRWGDTLGRIAQLNGSTVAAIKSANSLASDLIRIGQRLWIPAAGSSTPAPDPNPDVTPSPELPDEGEEGVWYTVRGGDTLGAIAARHGTTVAAIKSANSLPSDLIRIGQRLWIPSRGSSPAPLPQPQPQPGGHQYGFQIHPWVGDLGHAIALTKDAGFGWVKIQVPWYQVEPDGKGGYTWDHLDRVLNQLHEADLRVLVSVCKAPNWARRPESDLSVYGPPASPQDLADMLTAMATRYRGKIHAIEVWNEQNMGHEWGNEPLDAQRYVSMLCAAYRAIKAADPSIIVVSGAPTPTGVNDGRVAIDDLLYFQRMYQAGCKNCMDAAGVHPSGYNNPPNVRVGYTNPAEPNFKGHRSFFFQETMLAYRQVMVNYGDAGRTLWPTEFGWASSPDPVPSYEYAADNTLQEQADYFVQAHQLMRSWSWVNHSFVWNLNFNLTDPGSEMAQFGVYGRPAYDALKAMPK